MAVNATMQSLCKSLLPHYGLHIGEGISADHRHLNLIIADDLLVRFMWKFVHTVDCTVCGALYY